MAQPAILCARLLSKRFPVNGVTAVDSVSLRLHAGEITALIGDNGAGKSTLMHLLSGGLDADSGDLSVNGSSVELGSPAAALAAGIVIVHQIPQLVESLTVWENLVLGREPRTVSGGVDRSAAEAEINTRIGPPLAALSGRRASSLSPGEQRLVALMSALLRLPRRSAGVLILDEPTAGCTANEVEQIIRELQRCACSGHAVVLVTHKLDEVARVASRALIMRSAEIGEELAAPLSPTALAFALSATNHGSGTSGGNRTGSTLTEPSPQGAPSAAGLEVVDLSARHATGSLRGVSFTAARGEIVAITGTRDHGLTTLEDLLAGATQPDAGSILLDRHQITRLAPRARRRRGLGYVPTARFSRGASLQATVAENSVILERDRMPALAFLGNRGAERHAQELIDRFLIDGRPRARLAELSGGNAQRLVLAREIAHRPAVLVICEPSWGLDQQGRRTLIRELRSLAAQGAAVVLLTTEPADAIEIAGRVLVLRKGRSVLTANIDSTDRYEIARAMAGVTRDSPASDA